MTGLEAEDDEEEEERAADVSCFLPNNLYCEKFGDHNLIKAK